MAARVMRRRTLMTRKMARMTKMLIMRTGTIVEKMVMTKWRTAGVAVLKMAKMVKTRRVVMMRERAMTRKRVMTRDKAMTRKRLMTRKRVAATRLLMLTC